MNITPASSDAQRHLFPLLVLLSLGSGCAALIYQIVWFQLLQFVIGSSAVSLAVLLGTFMGGLCLGSLSFARVMSVCRHPLRAYGFLELGIAVFGLVVLIGTPLVGHVYATNFVSGFPGILLRGFVSTILLLPPTVLMGATLPVMGRWLETSPGAASQLGFIYSGNTVGAVLGCLMGGLYLLRVYDLATATYVAVALNLALALISFCAAALISHTRPIIESPPPPCLWRRQRIGPFTSRSAFLECLHSGLRWFGRDCFRCFWALRSTAFRSSLRASSWGSESAAA